MLVTLLLLLSTYPSFYNYSFDQYFQISYIEVTNGGNIQYIMKDFYLNHTISIKM